MYKIFVYNKFISCLYMFLAPCDHHQEVGRYYTASGIITHISDRPVRRLREAFQPVLSQPYDEHMVLETCRT